jgi:hypothetical protein
MSRSSVKPCAVADGQHEHRRGTVKRVAGGDLLRAGLQKISRGRRAGTTILRAAQDRKDAADRQVDVDVRRTVERVENQQILAARIFGRNRIDILHFLGGHRRQVAPPLAVVQESLVGQHVELLLRLALHVLAALITQHAGQRATRDALCNRLARAHDVADEHRQIADQRRIAALLLDQELVNVGTSA